MITLVPDFKSTTHSSGMSKVYLSELQHRLAESIRTTTAECLSSIKGWTTDLDYQLQINPQSKILTMLLNNGSTSIRVHSVCRFCWKSTYGWQFEGSKDSRIVLLNKYIKTQCDYVAMINRSMNLLMLIPKSEIENAEKAVVPIVNKFNGKTKLEEVAIIPFDGNKNLEFFERTFGDSNSTWRVHK